MAAPHTIYAVSLDGTIIGCISRQSLLLGPDVRGEGTSGGLYADRVDLFAQQPRATFASYGLKTALDAIGVSGAAIGGAGFIMYGQKYADGGGREGAGNHRSYTMADGIIVPRRLTCDHGAAAVIEYEALATWDGSNEPVVPASSQNLPADATSELRWSLGDLKIGNVTLSYVQSLEIDFGIDARVEGGDGDIWPTHVSIVNIMPTITIRGIDPDWFNDSGAIDLDGLACTHANTILYLRKRSTDGNGYVANVTAEHIKITAAGLAVIGTAIEGASADRARTDLMVRCKYDGTNTPVLINTASAIT